MTDWRTRPVNDIERRREHGDRTMAAWRAFCDANPEPAGRVVLWPYTLDNPSPASRRIAEQLRRQRVENTIPDHDQHGEADHA